MKMKLIKSGLAAGAALLCANAMAADSTGIPPVQSGPTVTFSGFGTIGAVQTNTDEGIFTTGQQRDGATKTADMSPDTKAGIQMDSKFNDTFSATVQIFSKENAVGSYAPDVEWAFGKIKLADGFYVRLGRIGAPYFMVSDFRNVGYTNISIRTSTDVYGLVPIRSFDGGDVLYRTDIGPVTLNSQFWAGKATTRIGQNAQGDEDITLKNIAGINVSLEDGPLTLRFGSSKSRLGTSGTGLAGFDGLLGTLNEVGAAPGLGELNTIADQLAINGKFGSFTGIGAILDTGNWVVNAEYGKRITDSTYIPSINAWYATLGYRISTFTPYISYSERSTVSTTSYPMPAVSPLLPLQIQGAVPVLVGTANGLLGKSDEKTAALGVRWDAGSNYDIKAEYSQIKVPAGSSGIFSGVTDPGGVFAVDTKVSVFSLAVDFVF